MTVKIDGTNTEANPAFTGADTDTGLQCGTNELKLVTGGTARATVDSSGQLLVGMSTARNNTFNTSLSQAFQIEGTSSSARGAAIFSSSSTDGEGGYLILGHQKSGSIGGNTAVTDDNELGFIGFQGNDGSEFVEAVRISAHVDGTPGSNDMPGRLAFSTTADSAAAPTERMRITNNGAVLVAGTTAYSDGSFGEPKLQWNAKLGSHVGACGVADTTSPINSVIFKNPNGVVGGISTSASATNFGTTSDYRLKENVVDIADGITRVKQLQPKRFNFIADADTTVDGFLAHEAQTVVPEAVIGTHDEVDDDGNAVMQSIDQAKLVPLLTAALQEAIAKIEALETKVAALEAAA